MDSKCNTPTSTPSGKSKRHILSMQVKLEVIEEYECGKSRAELMEKYGLKKTTIHGILKAKDKIRESMKKLESGPKGLKLFRSRKLPFEDLDEEVFQWYKKQRAEGVPTRGLDIQLAAVRLAVRLGHKNFKSSEGWLWRFRRRHGIAKKSITAEMNAEAAAVNPFTGGLKQFAEDEVLHRRHDLAKKAISEEMLNADPETVKRFTDVLKQFVENEELHHFQIYNADDTGLFWRSLPRNMQASREISSTPGHMVMKDRVSILVCSNMDGSHRLRPVVVGKSKSPRALKDIMSQLLVEYHGNKSAWFTQELFTDWFHHVFDPEVRFHQAQFGIKSDDVKAMLLLDNAPIHSSLSKLTSKDGRIRAMFLPSNTSSLIQPMNQGVIESCKRHYRKLYMQQCLVVVEDNMDKPDYVDTRGMKTLQNFKRYSLKDTINNWVEAWKKVPLNTLKNAWTKLLDIPKVNCDDFEGLDISEMANMLAAAGQGKLQADELEDWLNEDAEITGHYLLTEEEIAEDFFAFQRPKEEEEAPGPSLAPGIGEIAEELLPSQRLEEAPGPSLAAGIDAADTILSIIDKRGGSLMKHYEMMQVLRLELLQQQQ